VRFDILTIFPEFFHGPLEHGIVRRAREAGLVEVNVHDLRVFTRDKHKTVDDRPFGGGEGMVLKPGPVFECLESLKVAPREQRGLPDRPTAEDVAPREAVILLSAQGRLFHQSTAAELAQLERVVLICGRYEGVDERVSEFLADREISVGDYVLSGGELPAAIIVDAVVRLIPGALGNEASARQESFSENRAKPADKSPAGDLGESAESRYTNQTGPVAETEADAGPSSTCGSGGLLDYPHYTRPADFRGMKVPEVLVSGNHSEIRRWRRRKALEKTLRNRPDLLERVALSAEDRELIAQIVAEMRK
jgi:tRNA (guanine37-N1)-methyltransferase